MTMQWRPGAGLTARLRGAALAILFLLAQTACDDSHRLRLYVYPDSTGKNALFVNGQPVESFRKERGSGPVSGDVYEPYYEVKSPEPRFHVTIKAAGTTLYETSVEPGKYVANLSSDQAIWVQEIAYGRELEGNAQFLEQGKLGVHRLGKLFYGVVFKFDQEPPESIRTRRGGTDTEYFLLGTYTEKGIALRKILAADSQAKHKAEIEAKQRQKPFRANIPKEGVVIGRPEGKAGAK